MSKPKHLLHGHLIFGFCLALALIGAPAQAFDELVGDFYAYEGDIDPADHEPPIVYNTDGTIAKTSTDGNLLTFTDLPQYDGLRFTTAFNPPNFTTTGVMTMEMQIRVTTGVIFFIAGDGDSRISFGINPNGVSFYGLEDDAAIVTDFTQLRRLRVVVEGGQLSAYVDGEAENFVDHLNLTGGSFPAADLYANHAGQVTNAQLDYIRSSEQALHPELGEVVNAATTWPAYQ